MLYKSDFSYLPLGKARKVEGLKISVFQNLTFCIRHQGKLEKLNVKKSGKKSAISEVSEESEFLTWPSRIIW